MHFPKRQLSLFREGFHVTRSYRYRNQIKKGAEVPEGRVFLKYRSLLIRNLALELARLEREDDIAVAELVALIAWHRRDAEVAALDLRYDNNHHEQHLFTRPIACCKPP